MKNLIVLTTLLLFASCMKEDTIEDAKVSAVNYLGSAEVTNVTFLDNVIPDCIPSYRYRFAFTGTRDGKNVEGCICWTYADWIAIDVEDSVLEQEP